VAPVHGEHANDSAPRRVLARHGEHGEGGELRHHGGIRREGRGC
jgi:hypothetical protein